MEEKIRYKKSDFDYELPEELIAQTPAEPRDSSRLLVYDKENKTTEDKIFRDIADYLKAGDVLVVNNTKVIPARLYALTERGAVVEVLLLKRYDMTSWEVLMRPGKKGRIGTKMKINDRLSLTVRDVTETGNGSSNFPSRGYSRIFCRKRAPCLCLRISRKSLPIKPAITPYIARWTVRPPRLPRACILRRNCWKSSAVRAWRWPRCFCMSGWAPSAPSARRLLPSIKCIRNIISWKNGRRRSSTARKRRGGGVSPCTTSVRTLESVADERGFVRPCSGDTEIFLYPPYKMKCVDALITNFHLPESTLIMLVACMTGREEILNVYKYAVEKRYRFFSFGDAMFIK